MHSYNRNEVISHNEEYVQFILKSHLLEDNIENFLSNQFELFNPIMWKKYLKK